MVKVYQDMKGMITVVTKELNRRMDPCYVSFYLQELPKLTSHNLGRNLYYSLGEYNKLIFKDRSEQELTLSAYNATLGQAIRDVIAGVAEIELMEEFDE